MEINIYEIKRILIELGKHISTTMQVPPFYWSDNKYNLMGHIYVDLKDINYWNSILIDLILIIEFNETDNKEIKLNRLKDLNELWFKVCRYGERICIENDRKEQGIVLADKNSTIMSMCIKSILNAKFELETLHKEFEEYIYKRSQNV